MARRTKAKDFDTTHAAGEWLATAEGVGLEDLVIPNERPIRDVATEIVDWLDWTGGR